MGCGGEGVLKLETVIVGKRTPAAAVASGETRMPGEAVALAADERCGI